MKTLNNTFANNGLTYVLLQRTVDTCLFELNLNGEIVGFEVARIYQLSGKFFKEPVESISPNSKFGADGSKAFFQNEFENALKYFHNITKEYRKSLQC